MKIELTKPAPGTPVSASLICAIIDELKRLRLIETPGVRFGRSPSGTRIFIDQKGQTGMSGVHGCFDIRQPRTHGADDVGGFENPYYLVGSRVIYMPEAESNPILFYSPGKFVGISYLYDAGKLKAELVAEDALSTANQGSRSVFIPIYKVNSDGTGADIDFRIIPTGRVWDTILQ